MTKFKCHKLICKYCVATTRIPLDYRQKDSDTREPVLWTKEDDDLWGHGVVRCPQTIRAAEPLRAFCLKVGMQDAMTAGAIVVFDEN